MIAVPFVYFSILAIIRYMRHKTIDIASFICLMYGAAGLGAIMIDRLGLSAYGNYQVSFFACLAYCGLLTLCLLPFLAYSNLKIKVIRPFKNEKLLKNVAWVAFGWFLFTAIMSSGEFYNVITGDMAALRQALYRGDADPGFMSSLPSPIRFFLTILNMVFGCGWILIFLAFFSLLIQKLISHF